jgi:hypothetical protein
MGNQLTQPSRLVAAEAIADLGSVTFKDNLGEHSAPPTLAWCLPVSASLAKAGQLTLHAAGGGRFFKSALCVHDDGGLVVVKVRFQPLRWQPLPQHCEPPCTELACPA